MSNHTSNNLVAQDRILAVHQEQIRRIKFLSWNQAHAAGYRSRTQWRKLGKGVKGASEAAIMWKRNLVRLYHEEQTTHLKPKTLAIESLLDRFVVRTDVLVYQPWRTFGWKEYNYPLRGVRQLIRQGFHHTRCHERGITLDKKKGILAQAFSIRCNEKTDFFVIDLDCHAPSEINIDVHLELVKLIHTGLPILMDSLNGGSTFFQYRQIDTSGIQIWCCLTWKMNTVALQKKVRQFLFGLEKQAPGLNDRLTRGKLAGLGQIEIRPVNEQQISMPGCLGKTIYTSEELKLKDGWFDVQGLHSHIQSRQYGGNVLPRYQALLETSLGSILRPTGAEDAPLEVTEPISAGEILSLSEIETDGKRYWTDLKRIACEGISSADSLYESFLQPLGQCLYFRDFVGLHNRAELVEEELFNWVMMKHNGFVSRVQEGREREIHRQCRQVAFSLGKKTCESVKRYYRSILLNDERYPHRIEHLYQFMRKDIPLETEVKLNALSVIYCKCRVKSPENDHAEDQTREFIIRDEPLPKNISSKLMEIATTKKRDKSGRSVPIMRRKNGEYPFMKFSRRFLNEIWAHGGQANIPFMHLNRMLDLNSDDKDRSMAGKYKKLLVKQGMIQSNWEKYARRNAMTSKYILSNWAKDQFAISRSTSVPRIA